MNYGEFKIQCGNPEVLDKIQGRLFVYDREQRRADAQTLLLALPSSMDEVAFFKAISKEHPENKIEVEVTTELDDYTIAYLFEFLNGEGGQTGTRKDYMFNELKLGSKDTEDKIYEALTGYFRKIDAIPVEPEELIVTLKIDEYKVTAKKKWERVEVTQIQQRTMREVWEPVSVEFPF